MDPKQLKKSLSKLTALKNNLPPKRAFVMLSEVEEFHFEINSLEKVAGENLKEFKVPEAKLKKQIAFISPGAGRIDYDEEPSCPKEVFLTKLEGLISYLSSESTQGQDLPISHPQPVVINSHGGQFQVGNHNSQVTNITLQEFVEKVAASQDPEAKSALRKIFENSTAANIVGAATSALLTLLIKSASAS